MKLSRNWLSLCIVAFATIALVGCDDGGGTNNETDGTSSMDASTPDGSTPDAGTPDGSSMPDGTSTPDMVGTGTPIDITYPATPDDYVANPGLTSYISQLVIPAVDDATGPECCFDYGSISRDFIESDGASNLLDNALADLAAGIGGLSPDLDLQATLDEQLQAGTVAILFDHLEHSGTDTDADNFVLATLFGSFDTGTTYTEASAGTGSFLVNPSSFASGGTPLIRFNPAEMTGGAMMAGPADFRLTLPLGVVNLDVTISDTIVTGDATIGSTGVSYTNGTLSGYARVSELVNAINEILNAPDCACLGATGDIYTYDEATSTVTAMCSSTADADCAQESEQLCALLGGGTGGLPVPVCSLLGGLVTSAADIDLNGDCQVDPDNCGYEALSIGLNWTAAEATLSGTAAP